MTACTEHELLQEILTLHAARRTERAEALAECALRQRPDSAVLANARGVMLAELGRYSEAIALYRRSLALAATEAAVWSNLGNALTRTHSFNAAVACHDRAIALSPDDGGLHYNRGISLAGGGRHAEAVTAFTHALHFDPGHGMARWDRGRSYLHLGNLAPGWTDYAVRLRNGLVPPRPSLAASLGVAWDGSPFPGRRLVLLAEQGFGDMIWTLRYLATVKALGGEVIVECPPELAPLVAATGFANHVVKQGMALPECDLHLYQCSLPGLFSPRLDAVPCERYIVAGRDRITAMRRHIDDSSDVLRVGIVWSGSTTFAGNADRSQKLEHFVDAFDWPGVTLYSLQKGPPAAEALAFNGRVVDLAPVLSDFGDTAAAIAVLDLVIMCDSAVAHLAGAMGREVWLLLGPNAHWLWMQERADSPWYPSMRLFRPRGRDDWRHVFDQAAAQFMPRVVR